MTISNPSPLARAGRRVLAAIATGTLGAARWIGWSIAAVFRALRPKSVADAAAYGFVAVVGVPCIYWALLDTSPAAKAIGEVITPVVRQGEMLSVRYEVEWQRSCQLRAWRLIIDSAGQLYTIQPDERWVNEGRDKFVVSVPVPLAAQPGPAKYRATLLFGCNPWQRWFWPLEKQIKERTFEIMPGTPTAGGLQ